MSVKTGVLIGVLLLFAVLAVTYFGMSVSYRNRATELTIQIDKQTEVNKIRFDNSWKIVKQEAQVDDKYSKVVQDFYVGIMTGRYGVNGRQEGGFMNTLQESNPKFNDAMYEHLIETIKEQRTSFERDQKTLESLAQEYETLIKTFPGSFFLSDLKPIDIKIVTSTKTEKSFDTGVDDDVDVFDKPKSDTTKK